MLTGTEWVPEGGKWAFGPMIGPPQREIRFESQTNPDSGTIKGA